MQLSIPELQVLVLYLQILDFCFCIPFRCFPSHTFGHMTSSFLLKGTVLHLLNYSHVAASKRIPANKKELTVSEDVRIIGALLLSETS